MADAPSRQALLTGRAPRSRPRTATPSYPELLLPHSALEEYGVPPEPPPPPSPIAESLRGATSIGPAVRSTWEPPSMPGAPLPSEARRLAPEVPVDPRTFLQMPQSPYEYDPERPLQVGNISNYPTPPWLSGAQDFTRGLTVGSDINDPNESNAALVGDMVQNAAPVLKGPALLKGLPALLMGGLKVVRGGEKVDAAPRVVTAMKQRWPRLSRYLGKTENPVTLPGAARSPGAALDRLTQDIHARTLAEGGATTYPLTGAVETPGASAGYMAGKYSNQSGKTMIVPLSEFTPDHVRQYIEQHAEVYAKNPPVAKPQHPGKRAKKVQPPPPPPAIGTWIEPVNGVDHVFIDVAQRHPSQRQATVNAAYQAQPDVDVRTGLPVERDPGTGQWPKAQEAIFDLQGANSLPVGNLAEFLNSPEFRTRLDEMYAAGEPVMNGKDWWSLAGGPLERVYGPDRTKQLAGMLASTSSAAPPVHNLRAATEYIRRLIKGESVIQPEFRIPDTAVGGLKTSMGAVTPGDFNSIGTQMPMEATRAPNLLKVEAGNYEQIARDKMNDMYHALMGDTNIGVFDRRYAKIAEKPEAGIFVDATKDKVPGSMVDPGETGHVSAYALIENAVRDAAKAKGLPLGAYSAYVWEGIGDTIKRTGKLYGVEHDAAAIPDASGGFGGIFDAMVAEKAKAWGLSQPEFERRLRMGDAELLTALLATPAGLAAYSQWEQQDHGRSSGSPPAPPWQ